MKKTLAILTLIAGTLSAAEPRSISVTTNSTMVLPPRDIRNAVAWTAGWTNVQGDVVSSGNQFYWCRTGGTNGVTALSGSNGNITNGVAVWNWIPKDRRRGFTIVNDSTNVVYLAVGWPAVLNAGIRINANGGSFSWSDTGAGKAGDDIQGAIYAICATGSNIVTTADR